MKGLKAKLARIDRSFYKTSFSEDFLIYTNNRQRGINQFASLPDFQHKKRLIDAEKWIKEDVFYVNTPHILDHENGFAIVDGRVILKTQMSKIRHKHLWPSKIKTTFLKKDRIECGIVLFDVPWNYYHFINELIGALLIAREIELDPNIPLLVPNKLLDSSHFKQTIKHSSELARRKWIGIDHPTLVDSAYYFHPAISHLDYVKYFKSLLDFEWSKGLEYKDTIFLSRAKKWGRTIQNLEEVENLMKAKGIKIVTMDNLSVVEQIALFNSPHNIIGIHGASLINPAFTIDAERKLFIEIMSQDHDNYSYYLLTNQANYDYSLFLGEAKDTQENFKVDVARLSLYIDERLQ